MRAGGRILMIFGLVLGLIAAAATFFILQSSVPATEGEGGARVESVRVVVAVQPIEPWQEIPPDALQVQEYPVPAPADAVLETMPAEPDGEGEGTEATEATEGTEATEIPGIQYVQGKISNTRIYPGQVIVETQLVDKSLEEQRLGLGSNASYILPDGTVAMAIPVDIIKNVSGAIKAGDYVDIVATLEMETGTSGVEGEEDTTDVTQLFHQRVQILRVGPWSALPEEGGPGANEEVAAMVTIAVTPQVAAEIRHLIYNAGEEWQFLLRSITDETEFVTEPVTDEYLIEQFNLLP